MPRFVILEHDHPHLHWDLMLEVAGVLWTWRLPQRPQPPCLLRAERLPDHRLLYLDYEGPVSGGRGVVRRVAQGVYAPADAAGEALNATGRVAVELRGAELECRLEISSPGDGETAARFTPLAGPQARRG